MQGAARCRAWLVQDPLVRAAAPQHRDLIRTDDPSAGPQGGNSLRFGAREAGRDRERRFTGARRLVDLRRGDVEAQAQACEQGAPVG